MYRFKCWNCCYFMLIFVAITTNFRRIPRVRAAVVRQQPYLSVVKICRQETDATDADFEALIKRTKPPSMAAKYMRACLMKKFNLTDESGKFNRDVALHIVGDFVGTDSEKMHIATEIVDACYSMVVSENQ